MFVWPALVTISVVYSRAIHKMFLKTFMFFLLVNFVSNSYGQRDKKFFRKDYNYIEEVESFYKIHATPLGWTDAKRRCELEAATFFYPENDAEASAVTSFWRKTKPIVKHIWIGISDMLVEGVFETVDGKSISQVYTNWAHAEPNDHGKVEDCVALDQQGKMNDYICGVQAYFICKKSLRTLEWNKQCDMPILDYTLSKDIGKCYKLHTTPLKWSEAYAICQLEQSTLALINNRREADYLVKLTESTPKPARVKGKYQRGIYHLGFHNKLKDGWQTVKGTPLIVDADFWFDNYQPDGNDNEECGSMFYSGRLINTDCDMRSFFICEHEPDHIFPPASISLANSEPLLQPYVGGGVE